MAKPKISLVIPAYNEEKHIGACLEHALKSAKGRFHEVIVVDNASTDGTALVCSRYPSVKVVYGARKGLTHARQYGLEAATGDMLAYIDADTRMQPSWFDTLEKTLSRYPDIVALSGPYRYHDGARWKNMVMQSLWYLSAPLAYRLVGYMILGGNFVARKDALIAMGGFDTSIEFYGEDTDIARRIHKHGKVLFRMDFYLHTSSRRFQDEGLIRANAVYMLNFLWPVLFGKPFTKKHKDVRI